MSAEMRETRVPSGDGIAYTITNLELPEKTSDKIRGVANQRDNKRRSIALIADLTGKSRAIVNGWYNCKDAGPNAMEAMDAGWVQPLKLYPAHKTARLSWVKIDDCLSWIKNKYGATSSAFLRWEKTGYAVDKKGKPVLAQFEKLTIASLVLGLRKIKDIRCHVMASGIDSGDWETIRLAFSGNVTPDDLIGSDRSEFDAAMKRR